jgi:hypothetical protein
MLNLFGVYSGRELTTPQPAGQTHRIFCEWDWRMFCNEAGRNDLPEIGRAKFLIPEIRRL